MMYAYFLYFISYKSYLTYHLTYSKEALQEARVIIEEAEKLLSSPDSEGMTVEEIKEKARNNGYDRMEAVQKREREAKEKQEQERRQVEQQEARERWEREKKEIELKREENRKQEIRKREEWEARIEKKRELKQQLMEKRHLSTFTGVKNLVRIANGQGKNMCQCDRMVIMHYSDSCISCPQLPSLLLPLFLLVNHPNCRRLLKRLAVLGNSGCIQLNLS